MIDDKPSPECPKVLPAGVDPAGILVRVIAKPDGMTVSLYSTGETVLEKPGEPTITRRPDGRIEESRPKRLSRRRSARLTSPVGLAVSGRRQGQYLFLRAARSGAATT